jgi:hypothetical protein
MVVPNSKPLQFKILKFVHDSPVIRYPSYAKTYKIIQRVYYWPIIWKYVQVCRTCVHRKTSHIKKQGVL